MKTLTVTLEIDLSNLSEAQLRDAGWEPYDDEDGLPCVDDAFPDEYADLLKGAVAHEEFHAEMFAGSNIFAAITDVRASKAEWKA